MEGPANTISYFVAGYVVIFGVMLAYLASLIIRNRSLHKDLELFKELEEKDKK